MEKHLRKEEKLAAPPPNRLLLFIFILLGIFFNSPKKIAVFGIQIIIQAKHLRVLGSCEMFIDKQYNNFKYAEFRISSKFFYRKVHCEEKNSLRLTRILCRALE